MPRARRTTASLIAILVAALVLAGCGSDSATGKTAKAATPAGAQVDFGFSAMTIDGQTFDGASLEGSPALLWFWAPWCPTCAGQAPHVREIAETYAGKLTVVGVAGLAQASAMPAFVQRYGLGGITNLSDESGDVWKRFGITAQSTFVLLDAAGAVVSRGSLSQAQLDSKLAALAA